MIEYEQLGYLTQCLVHGQWLLLLLVETHTRFKLVKL